MTSPRTLSALLIVLAAGTTPAAATGQSGQRDPACAPVLTAMRKLRTTPHHEISREAGRPEQSEMIQTADTIYVRLHGVWKKSPATPQTMAQQEEENIRDAKVYSCQALPDEIVEGQPAAVYQAHSENDVGSADSKLWIAHGTGLVLRTEEDLPAATGKRHLSIRYDYANIQAPQGAR